MRIEPIDLKNQSRIIKDYRNEDEVVLSYFDYRKNGFEERLAELRNRDFNRDELATVLHTLNKNWEAPEETLANVERLRNKNAVVIIGGQQAGLLTGPLYTINKIVSIILLAKQQEEKLNIPVIPVFWIAGEDHDFDEINHVYLPDKETQQWRKRKTKHAVHEKYAISDIPMDKDLTKKWMTPLFKQLKETNYTKQIYEALHHCIEQSESYVDFFAHFIFKIFNEEGLVLIDSGNKMVRALESEFFTRMITNQELISKGVYDASQKLKKDGYTISLEVEQDNAHLFYHKRNTRILLTRHHSGDWIGKQNEVKFTTEELLSIAKKSPHYLSNNVVTRPLMQDLLFPSLAFVGGPGEIGYWSVLKPAFQALNINMPPVVPRLSLTYIHSTSEKIVNKYLLSLETIINKGINEQKKEWLRKKSNPPVEEIAKEIKKEITRIHEPLREIASNTRSDLKDLADKNLLFLHRDIDFLEKRIIKEMEEIYAKELKEFNMMNDLLHPMNGLQERIWNPLPLINIYGLHVFRKLIDLPLSFEKDHYVVYL